ncbi:MAG: cobalamin-dependent protein [Deltaproteobacteria bacterium]|nr:cobalamin-dependent protein [Deltaproteobacteria bacterium]
MTNDLSQELLKAILDADRGEANRLIDEWAARHGYESAVTEVLTPALEAIGQMYMKTGEATLAQGYVAGKIAEDVLTKVLAARQEVGAGDAPLKGPVVIGNTEDDYHPLGRKMVAAFLRIAGWEVFDLGVDASPSALVDEAVAKGARVVGASAMMYSTARNIRKLREEIDRRGLTGRLQLAVGGAVFKLRPELAREIGGDGTAATALQAPALFEELWNRSLALESQPGLKEVLP